MRRTGKFLQERVALWSPRRFGAALNLIEGADGELERPGRLLFAEVMPRSPTAESF
jgi:hypothetical protein